MRNNPHSFHNVTFDSDEATMEDLYDALGDKEGRVLQNSVENILEWISFDKVYAVPYEVSWDEVKIPDHATPYELYYAHYGIKAKTSTDNAAIKLWTEISEVVGEGATLDVYKVSWPRKPDPVISLHTNLQHLGLPDAF